MKEENIRKLLEKYRAGQCDEDESTLVDIWYEGLGEGTKPLDEEQLNAQLDRLDAEVYKIPVDNKKVFYKRYRRLTAIAATLLLLGGVGVYFLWKPHATTARDVAAPEGTNTRIVLENGEVINVDKLALQDTIDAVNYRIVKHASGQLEYLPHKDAPIVYNTVKTGTGGFISILLSDGTKVWLNANSSITYPIAFNPDFRDVKLTGEGYFEVAHSAVMPKPAHFFVKTAQNTVEVYGTKFIVDSYDDEYSTTLLEGKIGLATKTYPLGEAVQIKDPIVLSPKQQYNSAAGGTVVTLPDALSELDWKEGYFNLTGKPFATLSKELANWYGLPIELSEGISPPIFYGQLSKKKSLEQVLNFLSKVSDLKFTIQDGRVFGEKK